MIWASSGTFASMIIAHDLLPRNRAVPIQATAHLSLRRLDVIAAKRVDSKVMARSSPLSLPQNPMSSPIVSTGYQMLRLIHTLKLRDFYEQESSELRQTISEELERCRVLLSKVQMILLH